MRERQDPRRLGCRFPLPPARDQQEIRERALWALEPKTHAGQWLNWQLSQIEYKPGWSYWAEYDMAPDSFLVCIEVREPHGRVREWLERSNIRMPDFSRIWASDALESDTGRLLRLDRCVIPAKFPAGSKLGTKFVLWAEETGEGNEQRFLDRFERAIHATEQKIIGSWFAYGGNLVHPAEDR